MFIIPISSLIDSIRKFNGKWTAGKCRLVWLSFLAFAVSSSTYFVPFQNLLTC
jgi:hypothetical protein